MSNTEKLEQDLESRPNAKHDPTAVRHDEVAEHWDEKAGVAKGDDSDGRVNWTWKQIVATICLCGVYVGELSFRTSQTHLKHHTKRSPARRLADTALFCRR